MDGVLTDGRLWFDAGGQLIKRFDVRDDLRIRLLKQAGVTIALLSGGQRRATEVHALQLGIEQTLPGGYQGEDGRYQRPATATQHEHGEDGVRRRRPQRSNSPFRGGVVNCIGRYLQARSCWDPLRTCRWRNRNDGFEVIKRLSFTTLNDVFTKSQ